MSYLKYRALVPLLLIAPLLAACDTKSDATESSPSASSTAPAATITVSADDRLRPLEQEHDARLGVFAIDTGTGKTLGYRQDERFGIGSTFKGIACAALLRDHPLSTGYFAQTIHFTQADIIPNSPISETRIDTGMTVTELCDAAITRSDNTAGNQLLKLLGGPEALTAFTRSIGDQVTRLDRWEPLLNTNIPGDDRDTTTPAALAADYRAFVLGDVLATPERQQITTWLLANKTGDARIRAALPTDWKTADKTGTGDYATANDVAITWPTGAAAPLVIAIQSTKLDQNAPADNPLVAAAAKVTVETIH
ncbi:class A beta-lactamase [Nocardia sp. NPDC051030]|uniref:class A beta-lactamase n=1 Tax=Nocardia sp. NPDC051030 TaxID=3155162 RepID=UPI003413C633